MKTLSLALAFSLLPLSALADQTPGTAKADSIPVTVSAKGEEVRSVLMTIFDQEKKQYVIDATTHYQVFLSLDKADFHRALDIVCGLAGLQADLRDGIYFVHAKSRLSPKPELPPTPTPIATKPIVTAKPVTPTQPKVIEHPAAPKPVPPAKPVAQGPVPAAELQKHVTTRLKKTSLRTLFDELSKQTGVKIVVDDKVPAYKLDAYLINTSLRYALDSVTKAAGLQWKLPQDRTVLITTNGAKPGVAVIHS